MLLASGDGVNTVATLYICVNTVNTVNNFGRTPLFNAVFYCRLECIKVLLAAGAVVNYVDERGSTPLDRAIAKIDSSTEEARAKMVELLKAAGGLTAADLPAAAADDDDA